MVVVGKRVQTEVDDLRNLYRKECVQRKLLYNQVNSYCPSTQPIYSLSFCIPTVFTVI